MIALVASLCLAVQAEGSHAGLHPADVDIFVECPDVSVLLSSYASAPMVRMLRDEKALAGLRRLFGLDHLDGRNALQWGIDTLPLPSAVQADALDTLREIRAVSLSAYAFERTVSDEGLDYSPTGALLVVDLVNAAAADRFGDFFFRMGETLEEKPSIDPGKARYRAFRVARFPDLTAWVLHAGARVVVGSGRIDVGRWDALADGRAEALTKDAGFGAVVARLGPAKGAVVVQGYQRRSPVELILGSDPEGEDFALLHRLGPLVFGQGASGYRMQLHEGVFVTESFEAGAETAIPSLAWLGARPLGRSILEQVHPGVLIALASSLDGAGLRDDLFASLGNRQGKNADAVRAEIDAQLGFDSGRFFSKLGPDFTLFVYPIKGPVLPKTFLSVELKEIEGVFADIERLGEVLAESYPGFKARSAKYKGVPYLTLSIPEDTFSLGPFGSLRPAIAVLDGRLVITSGAVNLKREIRRLQGVEKEQLPPARYPWTGADATAALPADATFVLYVDWASQVHGLLSMARAFGPMIASLMEDLPFDLANPPAAELFTSFMTPTVHTVRRVDGGVLTRHEASFSFETWIGLIGIGRRVFAALDGSMGLPGEAAPAAAPPPEPEPSDRRARSLATMQELRTAITVYKLDVGAFPERLAQLAQPTANYPQGFLGVDEVPNDAWGRPFRYGPATGGERYRLWSTGSDGVDQGGRGDDVENP